MRCHRMPRRKTRSSARSWYPNERACRGVIRAVQARTTAATPPGTHGHGACETSESTTAAARTMTSSAVTEMSRTHTYDRASWCQVPSPRGSRRSLRGCGMPVKVRSSRTGAALSAFGVGAAEVGPVVGSVSGVFVIVVLPDRAQVLGDQACRDQGRRAHDRRYLRA